MTLTESQTMALEMFKGEIPCAFSTIDECKTMASWVCIYEHVEPTDCSSIEHVPVCHHHKDWIIKSTTPFWLMWLNTGPVTCDCGVEIKVAEWRRL
jgi:hypothetical protein